VRRPRTPRREGEPRGGFLAPRRPVALVIGGAPTRRRRITLLLALVGLGIATYLTLYQIDILPSVWDPVFGHGSRTVLDLTSPVPDAAAGVAAYGFEVILTLLGDNERERTLPGVVLLFGAVIATGGLASVGLIVVQPTVAGAWCLLCLGSAALSFALLAVGAPEIPGALERVRELRARGARPLDALLGRDPNAA